eukprot:TRINITY_DN6120_c1_g1_i1.p1 TRINITY_DN6120_c1_g1~~TRINITY_DN6120_c1_g1_i1.p1  ORF type:complete len:712 (-),score=164.13 TRINITY_DN6120_c1_g1_i1:724-2646(-)
MAGYAAATSAGAAPRRPGIHAAAQAAISVAHGDTLPGKYTDRIPRGDAQILQFLLHFLADQGLPNVPVYVNGGYVRDLLLGKEPDDLDLSLCLRECPEEVTVAGLLEKIQEYAEKQPELGIVLVKTATILSNESKDKQLDTFKAHFTNIEGVKIEVDIMPTIGEEKYDDNNRIPIRDQRGMPEEDALRRDLTIGALLMRVQQAADKKLSYELLDFYGGVEDIRNGVLRSPCPSGRSISDIREVVLRTPESVELAKTLGLDDMKEADAVQVLWWAKVLMDDPVRICRAFRFAAKFDFELHPSFWQAAPFALEHLRAKVAGSRKNTEYQKMGGYGFSASQQFFELAFTRTFGPGKAELRLADSLLGGQDEKARPKTLSKVKNFDVDVFRACASQLQPLVGEEAVTDPTELVGSLMAAAIATAEFEGTDTPVSEYTRACDGMCVSNAMREAGCGPLNAALAMAADPAASNSLDRSVAEACGVSAEELARYVQVWEAIQICNARAGPPNATAPRRRLALAVVQRSVGAGSPLAESIKKSFEALLFVRPPVKGSVLNAKGILEVPPPLRRQVMVLFEVCLRLLRYDAPVEGPEHLNELFAAKPALRASFSSSVWMEEDGKTLKAEFQPAKKGGGGGGKDAKRPRQ